MPQYQGVWTLEQQAQAQSNQQWVTDPNFKNTTLLLQADGTGSGSQNNTFLDGSTNNFFITRNGNTTQGSFSPFSQAPGYWSVYLNGSSSLDVASNAVLAMGTGDFTYEAWLCDTATPPNSSNPSHVIGVNSVGGGVLRVYDTGVDFNVYGVPTYFTYLVTRPIGTWYHLAYTRSGTTGRLFFNGALVASGTDSTNYSSSTNCIIGSNPTTGQFYTGYVSNARAIKGTALYTSSFTPQTTPLTAVSGTSLLTSQSNRFVDNSTNALAITVRYSAPSVQAFGPFAPALQWTPDVVGGSGYFDGNDYLTTPTSANLAMGSGDITAECWFYPKTSGNQQWMFDFRTSGSEGTTTLYAYISDSNSILYIGFGGFGDQAAGTPIKNAWNHVAVVRSGSGSNNVAAFLNGARTLQLTDTTNLSTSTSVYIGRRYAVTSSQYMDGYICGSRFVKGTAVYSPSSSTLTLPTAPPTAITNTQLLLNYTNAGIYDGKMANNLETVGNAQVATSPVKYGSGSISFGSGTANYLTYLNNPGFVFRTGDFTVEFWVNTFDSTACLLRFSTGTTGYWQMAFSVSSIVWQNSQDVNNLYVASCPQAFNGQWHHIAVTRTGGINRLFFDGTLLTSAADTTDYSGSAGNMQIGWDGSNQFTGFIDDLRITKGVARYIANFTPPQQALPRQ